MFLWFILLVYAVPFLCVSHSLSSEFSVIDVCDAIISFGFIPLVFVCFLNWMTV